MFLSATRIENASQVALKDLTDHLYERLFLKLNTELRPTLLDCIRAGIRDGIEFPRPGNPENTDAWFGDVLSRLLAKYDERSFTPPTVPTEIRVILEFLHQHMERLIPSSLKGSNLAVEPEPGPSAALQRIYASTEIDELFLELIRRRSGSRVQMIDCKEELVREPGLPSDPPADGFMSWIVITYRNDTRQVHVIYNKQKLGDIKRDPVSENHLMAKVFLHEFGHIRLHLQELQQNCADQRTLTPCAKPSEEVEAILYAHAIFGLILGLKAQLERILGLADTSYYG